MATSSLEKLELVSIDGGEYDIGVMFNPNQLDFQAKMALTEDQGARTKELGIPKVSFSYPNALVANLKDIIFDTYESNEDVEKKLQSLKKATQFVQGQQRPPIYILRWGTKEYMYCFIENVSYQLVMFSPNGTPIRAKASLSLKQVDPSEFQIVNPKAQPRNSIQSARPFPAS
jgi:hypothetical protein